MRRSMMGGAALLWLAACTAELPAVDYTKLACVDDAPLSEGGPLPCPASHHCVDGLCAPRLGCNRGTTEGCEREVTRCALSTNAHLSSVACESGLYVLTSTKAPDPVDCACPTASPGDDEPLLCVAMAGRPVDGAYPLFVLPEGGPLPSDALGVPAEVPDWRWCVVPCSSEESCPTDHTCRPAAVVTEGLAEAQGDGRHTVGVCYPNRLHTATSTVEAGPEEPDPRLCISGPDCADSDEGRACQYQVEPVPDHPFFPAGEAWDRRAFLGRCVPSIGLTPVGRGCTAGSDATCITGICEDNRCGRICDPASNDPDLCACGAFDVTRFSAGAEVTDSIHLCAQR